MSRKTRILLVNEFSGLHTGYSTYGREVMRRLHETGKFETLELACYCQPGDPRLLDIPWRCVPNTPDGSDPARMAEYRASKLHEFGEWKFEEACLAFRPDVVWTFRDPWFDEFVGRSPFRRHFHWAYMPTVDAEPLDDQWLDMFRGADGLFAYTDWGVDVLRRYGLDPVCSAPPGADLEHLGPVPDKAAHKRKMGLPGDALVVGFVGRNQVRKLFPDLIAAFAQFLAEAPPRLAERTYLYLHTGFPDQGWNLPRLIKDYGVGRKTLLTYQCGGCGASYPSHYMDAVAPCMNCKENAARLTNSGRGVGRDVLGQIYNLFDLYVQMSVCEGFGLPMVEAAACGVPVAAVDYSAMSDVVRKLGGYPVKVQRFYREAATHRLFALPDNDDLVRHMVEFLDQPDDVRLQAGAVARRGVLDHYTYDRTAKIWEGHFEGVRRRPLEETWGSPPRLHTPSRDVPVGMSDDQFVRWAIANVAGRPDLVNTYLSLRLSRDLAWGVTAGGMGGLAFNDMSAIGLDSHLERRPYTRADLLNEMAAICERQNYWERRRCGHD